jgi:microcystin degradation protein MlrC
MRVLLVGLYHETHCFVPERTSFESFRIERGEEILRRRGDGSPIDGFLEVASRRGWEIVPAVNYTAMPSGPVEDRVFETFWAETESAALHALDDGLSAVFLSLHGAMVTETIEDVEGELLERLRALPGMVSLPVFGVFDLHATFSERMARHANGLVCYRENPHIDARESAVRAAELLDRTLSTGHSPRMLRLNPPIIWPPTGTGTADRPMRDLERLARVIESETPGIWAVNVVAGYSFADAADAGVSFSVVTIGPTAEAQVALDKLADCAFALKELGLVAERPPDEVLATIVPVGRGPVLLVEPADNIGGGAPGDGTGILRALLRHRVAGSAVVINDPECVAALTGTPIGGRATLPIGGKGSLLDEGPVILPVELLSRSDGRFELEDPNSHLAAMQGRMIDMGPCAVARYEGITILLTSRKTPPFDLGQLRSQGIEPTALSVIGIKAAVAHRRAYDPIAVASHTVRTPGPCTSDPCILPYRRLRRPIFPVDSLEMEPS